MEALEDRIYFAGPLEERGASQRPFEAGLAGEAQLVAEERLGAERVGVLEVMGLVGDDAVIGAGGELAVGGSLVGVNVEIIQRKAHALDGVLPMAPHAGRTHHGAALELMEGHRGEDLERLAQPRLIGEEVVEVGRHVLGAYLLERLKFYTV